VNRFTIVYGTLTAAFGLTLCFAGETPPIRAFLEDAVKQRQVAGAVVVVQQHGTRVCEEAVGFADLDTRRPIRLDNIFMLASSSKPWAASAIMTMVDQGKLSLDDKVSKYFPEFQASSTIRQLMSHTSGIFGNAADGAVTEPIRNFDRSLKDAVPLILKAPLEYQPGTKYSYGGASFCVAGRIVEMLSGMEFDAYMRKVLLDPVDAGETVYRSSRNLSERVPVMYRKSESGLEPMQAIMELPGRRGPRPDGFVLVPGGIYSTAHDCINFLQMHLNGGTFHGRRVLSEASVMEMRRKQTGSLANEYGLGWNITKSGVEHGGAYGTLLFVDTTHDAVGAIMIQMPSANAKPFLAGLRPVIEKLLARQ
jgi:CubicO group peptidase (beta-lactamase class C family)